MPGTTSWSEPPAPVRTPAAAFLPPLSFPGGRRLCPTPAETHSPAPSGRGSPTRFKRLRSGTPTPPAPGPVSGGRDRGIPRGYGEEARSSVARATVPLETQVRRVVPKPCPTSPGTCRALSRRTSAHLVPWAHGWSPRLWTQLPPPSPPGPQPRPPPTFGFLSPPSYRCGSGITSSPRPAPLCPAPLHPAPGSPSLGCAHARAPRPRPPTPASARGKENRRRLAVSARAHARAEGEDDCGVSSGAPPHGQREYRRAGRDWDPSDLGSTDALLLLCSFSHQKFHSTLAHLIFILLDGHPVRSFPLGVFQASLFQEGSHSQKCQSLSLIFPVSFLCFLSP